MRDRLSRAIDRARDRYYLVALLSILIAIQFLPRRMPPGIYGLGVVAGAALAIQAVGIILVYRSNRIINFAHLQVGAVAATFFASMVRYRPLVRLVRSVCPPCLETVTPGFGTFNYWLSLALSLALALLLGYATYRFVVRRFSDAPRLVVTVATIFVAQLLAGIQTLIPYLLSTQEQRGTIAAQGPARLPFDFSISWSPARFHAPDILTVLLGAGALGVLVIYLRKSSTGIAIRASSENPARATTLGVDVDAITGRVWMIAGGLSGIVGLLTAMSSGPSSGALSASGLVRILTVAVLGGFASIPVTAVASVVFGILDQSFLWSFGSIGVLDGLLLFIIAGILMLQRYRATRADFEQASVWQAAREIRPLPKELRPLPGIKKWTRYGIGGGTILLLVIPWALSPSQTNLAAFTMIFGILGLSLLILTGWAGQISLGQFAFAAVGGYVAAAFKLPFLLALPAGAIAGAAVAVAVGLPALKLRGLHLAVTTLALSLTATALLLNPNYLGERIPRVLDRPSVLGLDLDDQRVFYYFTLLCLAAVVAAVMGMRRSRIARALIAARDNEPAAQSFGINLVRARVAAFAVSGLLAAFAGALLAFHQHGVEVRAFSPEQSVTVFLMTIIGGLGSIAGPLIGALYLGILNVLSANAIATFLATGGGGLILLLVTRGGLGQLLFDVRDAVLRRIAQRNRIVVPSLLADFRLTGELKAPVAPNLRPGRRSVFVPHRYRLDEQWALPDGDGGTVERTGGPRT